MKRLFYALFFGYVFLILGITTLYGLVQLALGLSRTPVTDVVFLVALIGALVLIWGRLMQSLAVKAVKP